MAALKEDAVFQFGISSSSLMGVIVDWQFHFQSFKLEISGAVKRRRAAVRDAYSSEKWWMRRLLIQNAYSLTESESAASSFTFHLQTRERCQSSRLNPRQESACAYFLKCFFNFSICFYEVGLWLYLLLRLEDVTSEGVTGTVSCNVAEDL